VKNIVIVFGYDSPHTLIGFGFLLRATQSTPGSTFSFAPDKLNKSTCTDCALIKLGKQGQPEDIPDFVMLDRRVCGKYRRAAGQASSNFGL